MDEIFVDDDGIKYLVDEGGEMHFISDRKVRRRITQEDDYKFQKWEQFNLNMAKKGGKAIECYEEFLVDILDCVLSVEEVLKLEEYRQQQGYIKYMKSKSELDTLIRDELGVFYFNVYRNLLDVDLEPQYKFRFVYLCTYMNYDNKLVLGNQIGDGKLAKEGDLVEILNLSQNETIRTKKALIEANLIAIEEDKTISIDKKYAVKGKIGKKDLKGSVRIMENGVQQLYQSVGAREHKKLALFIEILPYINFNHNIVCSNPNESNAENIEPINLTKLANIMGYSTTQKLKKGLMDIKVNGKSLIMVATINSKNMIVVNPSLYYKGNNIEALRGIINLFKIADRK